MHVVTVESDYSNFDEIRDLPFDFFDVVNKSPLYIAAREGQLKRADKETIEQKKGTAIGLWQLGELEYLTKDGQLNTDRFLSHDIIFVADPARVAEPFRPAYEKMLWQLKAL